MAMVRKQIYLTQELDEKVKQLAKQRNVPEAEIIRAALEAYGVYRAGSGERLGIAEAATLSYGVRVMDEARERLIHRVLDRMQSGSGRRFLDIALQRMNTAAEADGRGRSWTREDLYDERPKYLSR